MANLIKAVEPILKTDVTGRVRTPPERRQQLLEEFERSGLSGAKFAELAGIKYQTFAAWVARRRKQTGAQSLPAKAVDPVRWLEAVMSEASAPGPERTPSRVRVQLPGGAWLELNEPAQAPLAAALLQALSKPLPTC